jgi:uncharacterized membrane protein YciS (DUF1049 family)
MVIEEQHMANENWHLSKTIPVSFLVGIVVQTFVIGWFIADAMNEVQSNTQNIQRNESDIKALENKVNDHSVMMGRIDENLKFLREYIEQK